jgi:3-oxoadipate enol-lactonase
MANALVNGVEVHFTCDGPPGAPVVVMLHGFARNGTFWRGWMPSLVDRFKVVRPDLRGCGRSADPGVPFRLEDAVGDVLALADDLGLPPMHFVGESTGGIVGVMAAARRPERFASLALVSTPLSPARGDDRVMSPGAESPVESLRALGLRRWWLESRALSGDLFGDRRDEEIATEFARTRLHVAISMWEAMHDENLTLAPYLPRLRLPVLVMTPTSSPTVSVDDQSEIVAAVEGARQIVYPGAPHFMMLLEPERLAKDYVAFLDSI